MLVVFQNVDIMFLSQTETYILLKLLYHVKESLTMYPLSI